MQVGSSENGFDQLKIDESGPCPSAGGHPSPSRDISGGLLLQGLAYLPDNVLIGKRSAKDLWVTK
jgi:hypothetical protein